MTIETFKTLTQEPTSKPLAALWYDVRGEWEMAHRVVQEESTSDAAWVHAYLHRKEGDAGNARYWYDRAGRPEFQGALEAEWLIIAETLLAQPEN